METFKILIDIIIHLDEHLITAISDYGPWIYSLLFGVIFAETGFIFTPFLPGDSLLFAAGALASRDFLSIELLFIILTLAAIIGDAVNYWFGRLVGPKIFNRPNSKLFNKKYLYKTHDFYERHGSKTIIIARFIPIIRTFAPFVAGIARMNYTRFALYNILGAFLWTGLFLGGGYFFGNLSIVKENFSLVIIIIIATSLIPAIIEYIKSKLREK